MQLKLIIIVIFEIYILVFWFAFIFMTNIQDYALLNIFTSFYEKVFLIHGGLKFLMILR